MTTPLPAPVQKYLEQFELALKDRPVTSVEDALSDAREHLVRDWQALTSAGEARTFLHRFPYRSTLIASAALCLVVAMVITTIRIGLAAPAQLSTAPFPVTQPWKIVKNDAIPVSQVKAIAAKLNINLSRLSNTIVDRNGDQVQINTLECPTPNDADKAYRELLKVKKNSRLLGRRENTIFEFVTKDAKQARTALLARYELGFQPKQVKYQVEFDAAPLKQADGMEWNRMFNYFRQAGQGDRTALTQIEAAKKHFTFDNQLALRTLGLGNSQTKWTVIPKSVSKTDSETGLTLFDMSHANERVGIAYLHVTAEITSSSLASVPYSGDAKRWLESTKAWPANDAKFRTLATQITKGQSTDEAKLRAMLDWFAIEAKVKFGGEINGSRYGASKVLDQGFGHCWDFSDVMVTLCRAANLPSRQVFGWLDQSEGHVWVEVLVNQQWQAVDPTTGIGCGSDYIPLTISNDGEPPLLYLSDVAFKVAN